MRRAVIALFLLACAAPQPAVPAAPGGETREVSALMDAYEQELYGSETLVEGADCGRACMLAGNICDLAGRICTVAERHPQDGELRRSCEDGKLRCDRARKHVAQRCLCPQN